MMTAQEVKTLRREMRDKEVKYEELYKSRIHPVVYFYFVYQAYLYDLWCNLFYGYKQDEIWVGLLAKKSKELDDYLHKRGEYAKY